MDIGTTLSHYRITAKLGEGGMGEVYRAEDMRLKRDVAVKVLPAALADDPERLARLQREAQLLAQLEHPNVAAIYGLDEAAPIPPSGEPEAEGAPRLRFLVMQLAEGDTLDELLDQRAGVTRSGGVATGARTAGSGAEAPVRRGRGLPLEDALPIAAAVAEALEAAHDRGIVHRDLKPANVKVAHDGGTTAVKVLDFGLAKAFQADGAPADISPDLSASPTFVSSTGAGVIMGTAGYMSPEQARGQRIDRRADVWAFGVMLYEMLTGERLFHGATVSDTLAAVLRDEVRVDNLPAGTPLPIRRLLRRCLQRDPRRRLKDMGDARLELRDAAAGLLGEEADDIAELTARGGDVLPDLAAARSLSGWRLPAAASALLAGGALLAWLAIPGVTPTGERAVRMYGDLGPTDARSAVISPDGNRLALDIDGSLALRGFDTLTATPVEGGEDVFGRPFWSPDSTQVAFFAEGGLHVARVDEATARRVPYEGRLRAGLGGVWGPEGIIVAAGSGDELVLLSPDGSDSRTVARSPGPGNLRFPAIMPDGNTLVYEYAERGGGVFTTGVVRVQRGLTPEAAVDTIVQQDDSYVGFRYVEELEILLLESTNTGLWTLPLSREGFTPAGPLERLFRNGEDMSLSNDGTLVYRALTSRLESQPFRRIDRRGEALETIESVKLDARWLALSPDATRVAFMAPREPGVEYDIWVRDLQRGAETLISSEPGAGGFPTWQGDDRLVFAGEMGRGGGRTLVAQAASGAGRPEELGVQGILRNPSASMDGRFVVFEALTLDGDIRPPEAGSSRPDGERGRDGRSSNAGDGAVWNLWYIEGSDARPVLYQDFDDNTTRPALSPDGGRVAFISDASGTSEVWVDTFPAASDPVRISVSGGANVRWAPDGEELLFDDGAGTMWSVELVAGAAHGRDAYREPVRLFAQNDAATNFNPGGARGWDVGPGGETFITVQRYAEGISPVNVIENFPRWFRDRPR